MILALVAWSSSFAQLSERKSDAQKWMDRAVSSTMFITRQGFQIENNKTGSRYGYKGNLDFGYTYSVGVKTTEGYLLSDRATKPWLGNKDYEKFSKEYTPVISSEQYSELHSKALLEDLDYDSLDIVKGTSLWLFSTKQFAKDVLCIDNTDGQHDGWLVWVRLKNVRDTLKAADIDITSFPKPLMVKKESQVALSTNDLPTNALGGIYVTPRFDAPGTIRFELTGVLAKAESGWTVQFPFVGKEIKKPIEEAKAPAEPKEKVTVTEVRLEDLLTPVSTPESDKKGKSKKTGKDESSKTKKIKKTKSNNKESNIVEWQ